MDWESGFIANIIISKVPGKPKGIKIFGVAERRYNSYFSSWASLDVFECIFVMNVPYILA